MNFQPKPSPYTLDCMHVIWLRTPPAKDDVLWCVRCRNYEPLLLTATSTHAEIYDPAGEFMAQKVGKRFQGTCLHKDCDTKLTSYATYDTLKKAMHVHFMRSHTEWGASVKIVTADRLPPGSPAPF